MIDIPFQIVRVPYPQRSGMTGTVLQKVRGDGRVGETVGDEALLWDALQEARSALAETKARLEHVSAALSKETEALLDAQAERDKLRIALAKLEGLTEGAKKGGKK